MSSFIGITITKSSLVLTSDHLIELCHMNIGVREEATLYILYYKPNSIPTDVHVIQHLKNTLKRVKSDVIYNNYNDDFGLHVSSKLKPSILKK